MSLPTHIAIIPDGNRRWAKTRGLPSFMGHREGAKTAEKILEAALEQKIPFMTLWIASVSNLVNRDAAEVKILFEIFTDYFNRLAKNKSIHENQISVQILGRWREYAPADCQKAAENLMEATKNYHTLHLTFLFGYSGTEEMLAAVQAMVANADTAHPNRPTINETFIKQHLYTKDLPPVDLVIRTGGEPHLSAGFMMWDVAEAQLYFSGNMWPDFSPEEFLKTLAIYDETERRLGK